MAAVMNCHKFIGIIYNNNKKCLLSKFLLSTCRTINVNGINNVINECAKNLKIISTVNITSNAGFLYWASKLQQQCHNDYNNNKKQYSTSPQEPQEPPKPSRKSLPQLMSFPKIVWPSVFKSIKNWIMINFIVRPYFDKSFNLAEFTSGTKHALQV